MTELKRSEEVSCVVVVVRLQPQPRLWSARASLGPGEIWLVIGHV